MLISLIAAVPRNRVIGLDNDLPWRLPDDFRYFKRQTLGKPCLMARKTFESLAGALKGRTNIVLTTQTEYQADGGIVVHSIEEGLQVARREGPESDELMILGGATLYEQTLPIADRLYITEIDAEFEGDTFFPEFDRSEFREVSRKHHPVDDRHAFPFDFVLYERITAEPPEVRISGLVVW